MVQAVGFAVRTLRVFIQASYVIYRRGAETQRKY